MAINRGALVLIIEAQSKQNGIAPLGASFALMLPDISLIQ